MTTLSRLLFAPQDEFVTSPRATTARCRGFFTDDTMCDLTVARATFLFTAHRPRREHFDCVARAIRL